MKILLFLTVTILCIGAVSCKNEEGALDVAYQREGYILEMKSKNCQCYRYHYEAGEYFQDAKIVYPEGDKPHCVDYFTYSCYRQK